MAEVGSRNHLPRGRPGLEDVEETIVDVTAKLREAMWMPRERAGPRRPALRGVHEDRLVPVADRAGGTGHRSTVSMGHGVITVVVVVDGPERDGHDESPG
jgi:hypothetical protein